MPEWATFVGFTTVVTAGLLVLSHVSSGVITNSGSDGDGGATPPAPGGRIAADAEPDGIGHREGDGESNEPVGPKREAAERSAVSDAGTVSVAGGEPDPAATGGIERSTPWESDPEPEPPTPAGLSTTSLLANVALSQGLFGVLLLFGAWVAEIPAAAFGVGSGVTGLRAVAIGTGLGLSLYIANELGAAAGARFGLGVGDGQRLREALAPETTQGWLLLLFVVLPIIAGFEELLFRGAIVGVVSAGYGVSAWVMAVVAAGAFALGHGAQGRLGVVVTGALGFVLAAAFVLTESLVVVVVAHYLVNALEFVVHEGIGVEWPPAGADQ
jgi:membrane protease YdiL (CAAX protease family)